METFGLQPCKEIGLIKSAIKKPFWMVKSATILKAHRFMMEKGKELGLG